MKKENKALKRIDKLITVLLIAFILVSFALSVTFTYYRSQNKLVNIFGYSVCYVITGSMEPELQVGDVILIKEMSADQILEGFIITYESRSGSMAGNYITHRVDSVQEPLTENDEYYFRTKGDANSVVDAEIITIDQIKGVYQKKLPLLQFIVSMLSNPIIFIFAIIIPLLFSLIMQLVEFIITLKESREE